MLNAHIAGTLTADPVHRTTANGAAYVTANVRVPVEDDDAQFVAVVAFEKGVRAALAGMVKGDPVSLSGPAKLRTWTGRDGGEKHGLSVLALRVIGGKPERRRRQRHQEQRRTNTASDSPP
jgi:single-stranded DNA-binding protein